MLEPFATEPFVGLATGDAHSHQSVGYLNWCECSGLSLECRYQYPGNVSIEPLRYTEQLIYKTALCGILFGLPDPKLATIAKRLFQQSLEAGEAAQRVGCVGRCRGSCEPDSVQQNGRDVLCHERDNERAE